MIIGGSTTALLSFMNSLDSKKYNIDLQLLRNEGPLLDAIPKSVNLLPPAEVYSGIKGRIIKLLICFFKGYFLKALYRGATSHKGSLISRPVLTEFQARELSRKNDKIYDYAIGFLEGWSNRYLAFCINANHKYAWLHSTFENITAVPALEIPWMKNVDKIIFVTDSCRNAFIKTMPEMNYKTITIENIMDNDIILNRSLLIDEKDEALNRFASSQKFKIITVCRLQIATKGLDRIVSCAKRLKENGFLFLWCIVGDGEEKTALIDLINNAGVNDCVIPVGKRMNPYPFIASADIMCMPSRYEGKPITITESMILGVPPVVTEYLSAHEQIRHNTDGIVVENNDVSVYNAIVQLIKNKKLLNQMKETLKAGNYGNTEYISFIERQLFYENEKENT